MIFNFLLLPLYLSLCPVLSFDCEGQVTVYMKEMMPISSALKYCASRA